MQSEQSLVHSQLYFIQRLPMLFQVLFLPSTSKSLSPSLYIWVLISLYLYFCTYILFLVSLALVFTVADSLPQFTRFIFSLISSLILYWLLLYISHSDIALIVYFVVFTVSIVDCCYLIVAF